MFGFSSSKSFSLVLLLIVSLITILRIGDFGVRLANTINDESIITFSRFLNNPQRYKGDVLEGYGYIFGLGSIVNSLPHLISSYFKVSLNVISWCLICLQSILIALAFFSYAKFIIGSDEIAWITALFAVIAMPWIWNLANYGSFLYSTTYPACFAVSLIIFAAVQAMKNKRLNTILILIVCGLIHPFITVWMTFLVGSLWVFDSGFKDVKGTINKVLPLGIVIVICAIPALLWTADVSDRLTRPEALEVFGYSMHSNPTIYPMFWHYRLPMFIWMSVVLFFVFRLEKKYLRPGVVNFLFCVVITVFIFSLMHILGWVLKIPRFVQMIGLRTSMLLMIFCLPLLISYLLKKIEGGKLVFSWAAGASLLLQAIFSFGIFWGSYFSLFFLDYSQFLSEFKEKLSYRAKRIDLLGQLVFLFWVFAILGFGAYFLFTTRVDSQPIMALLIPAIHIDGGWFLFAIIASLFLAITGTRLSKSPLFIKRAILIVLIIIGFLKAYGEGAETRQAAARANYQAQVWARANTNQDDLFLVLIDDTFWRVVSDRRVLYGNVYFRTPGYFYSFSRKTKHFEDEIKFFLRELKGSDDNYDEDDILIIARRFGIDFVVGSTTSPLKFDEVYKNDYQVIYKLPGLDKGKRYE